MRFTVMCVLCFIIDKEGVFFRVEFYAVYKYMSVFSTIDVYK
jgi:hypothetical protein